MKAFILFITIFLLAKADESTYSRWEYFTDEDILGFDGVDYTSKEQIEKAEGKVKNENKVIENEIKQELSKIDKEYCKIGTSCKEKRLLRNRKRALEMKVKQNNIKILNYEEMKKKF